MSAHRWRGTRYATALVVAVVVARITGGALTRDARTCFAQP